MYRCLVLKNNSLEVYSPFSVKLPGNTRDRVTADVASFALYRSAKWHLSPPSPPPTNRPILKLHTTKASEYNHVFTLYWPLHSLKLPSTSPVTHQKIKSFVLFARIAQRYCRILCDEKQTRPLLQVYRSGEQTIFEMDIHCQFDSYYFWSSMTTVV